MAGRWTVSLSAGWGGLLLGKECCGFPLLPGGLRPGRLLVVLHSPKIQVASHHSSETTKISETYSDDDITLEATSLCVFLRRVEVISTMSGVGPPRVYVCVCWCTSSLSHAGLRMIQTSRRGLVLWQGRWMRGAAKFSLWLWKMEASFMTRVPCPPVKITPAVSQRCSIISCVANENNGACGEETRQTKKERKKSWTGMPAGLLYTYTSSFPFPSDPEVDPPILLTDI